MAAGELLLAPARAEVAARALAPAARQRAHRGRRAGAGGGDGGSGGDGLGRAGRGRVSAAWAGRRPAAPGGVPDPDREPGGRHAARAGGAARRRRGGLRGHPAHARAARPLRRVCPAGLLPRAQRGARARASWWSGCAPGRWWRWCPTPACRWCRTPASCWFARAWRRGWRWRCCPGPRRPWPRWWPRACRRRALALRGLPAPPARRSWRSSCRPPRRWWRSSRPAGWPPSLAVLAELDGDRPVAVCRELTKRPRGGGARDGVGAGRPLRGSASARRGGAGGGPGGGDGGRVRARGGRAGAAGRGGRTPRAAAKVVAELTGVSANTLYRALTAGTEGCRVGRPLPRS